MKKKLQPRFLQQILDIVHAPEPTSTAELKDGGTKKGIILLEQRFFLFAGLFHRQLRSDRQFIIRTDRCVGGDAVLAAGKLHMVGGDLQGSAVLTVLVHIGAKGQITLDSHLVALVQILSCDFSEAAPGGDTVEDGDIVAAAVLLAGIRSLREGGALGVVDGGDHGIGSQTASNDNQVHAHNQPSMSDALGAPLNVS